MKIVQYINRWPVLLFIAGVVVLLITGLLSTRSMSPTQQINALEIQVQELQSTVQQLKEEVPQLQQEKENETE